MLFISINDQPEFINLDNNNYSLMLNGVTDSRQTDMLSVITQPLHRLKLHAVNFMQTKNTSNKLVRLIAVTVCGAANVNKTKDTTHPQG